MYCINLFVCLSCQDECSSKCCLTKLIWENLDLHSSLEFFNHSFGLLALMCHDQLLIIQTTTEAVPSSCQYNNTDMHFIGCFVKKTSKLITHLRIEKKILLNGQTRQTKSFSRCPAPDFKCHTPSKFKKILSAISVSFILKNTNLSSQSIFLFFTTESNFPDTSFFQDGHTLI